MKNILLYLLLFTCAYRVSAQKPYAIVQKDTTVAFGTQLLLSIDSTRAYSNFIFSALNPQTSRWTIWWRNSMSGKYEPLFQDAYNRMNVVVSADKKELLYVRYKPQREGAMYNAMLDSAWVCRSNANGYGETVVFAVPEFNKNAVYDLDWSADKNRILYSYGNDQYPGLTRDGDIFEYNISLHTNTNLTNDWQLWSKNCRYMPNSTDFAYSHFANFWEALPTDIFLQQKGQPRREITNSIHHSKNYKYCTLTDCTEDYVIYRRGLYFENKLYRKQKNVEELLPAMPGYGGTQINTDLFAAPDFYNNIWLFTSKQLLGNIKVSGIKSFAKDNAYNFALDCNTRLNWMGKQPVKVKWNTGDTTLSIKVNVTKNSTYYCTVQVNGIEYSDSVLINVTGPKPTVTKNCLTLSTNHYKSYQWLQNGNPIAGATDSAYTPQAPGSYAVTVTDKKDRQATSAPLAISDKETESLLRMQEQVIIKSDPSTSKLTFTAPFPLNVIVIDSGGSIISRQNNIYELNMNDLPDGVYNLIIYNNDCLKLKTHRVVKNND